MAGTKNAALRNLLADAFADLWNAGTLEIGNSGFTSTACTFNFDTPAFSTAATGAVSAYFASTTVTATDDVATVAEARMISSGSTYQLTGLSVGTSGTDVIIDNTNISSGQSVTINSLTWTESASSA